MRRPRSRQLSTVQASLVWVGLLIAVHLTQASAATIDFEGFPDSTILTTQYPGVTFSNAIILTAGISLNEFELPPHSGVNVASDNGGPMTIAFASPITSFSGYFTYLERLTVAAFNASHSQIATATSAFSTNDALFGDPGSSPNEFIHVSYLSGISSVEITGDLAGASFALDDVAYATTAAVPEPTSGSLLIFGVLLSICFHRKPLIKQP